jgi:hypothetical protein
MTGRALPAILENEQGDQVSLAVNIKLFDVESRRDGVANAYDGDGVMLGRVLIYASTIAVIVAVTIWQRIA